MNLKPCPFCGGEATLKLMGDGQYKCVCTYCNAGTDCGYKELSAAQWNWRTGGWIREKKRLPNVGDWVLVFDGKRVQHAYMDSSGRWAVCFTGSHGTVYYVASPVTHWQPLPDPPMEDTPCP